MRIALVGCGFVADYYVRTIALHPELTIAGVYDRQPERAERMSQYFTLHRYASLDELLADSSVQLVVNLTNPRNHFEVSFAALSAGKHVYSEKPLGMTLDQGRELLGLAEAQGLRISSAPATLLGESAQTLWKALRKRVVGDVYLTYAEMDDGLVPKMPYQDWKSESGVAWPAVDEFEIGCTIEHAGYCLTWLTAFFGPVASVTAFSAPLIPGKLPHSVDAADFSVACLQFESGQVARLTCGIVAPHDHRMRFFGEAGVLTIDDVWNADSKVYLNRFVKIRRRLLLSPLKERRRPVRKLDKALQQSGSQTIDFGRGIADLAAAISHGTDPCLREDFCLHNLELTLAIHAAGRSGVTHTMETTFREVSPQPWAG